MGQNFAAINSGSGGDTVKTGIDNLDERTDTLRTCFSGTSAPSSPEVGQLWLDTSATPNLLKQYKDVGAGNAWVVILTATRDGTDIVGDANSGDTRATLAQLKGWRIENRSGAFTPAAGNVGGIYLDTDDASPTLVLDASTLGVLCNVTSASYDSVDIPLDGTNWNDSTPPTAATKGTSPTVHGWLFDATGEKMCLVAKVPANWNGASDLKLRLTCVLNAAETNGDDIEWSGNLVAVTTGTDAVSKTSTATAASATDIGTASSEGSEHECDLTIDYDDADNPVTAGDTLYIEINRTEVTNVAGVIVTAARLLYTPKARFSRA